MEFPPKTTAISFRLNINIGDYHFDGSFSGCAERTTHAAAEARYRRRLRLRPVRASERGDGDAIALAVIREGAVRAVGRTCRAHDHQSDRAWWHRIRRPRRPRGRTWDLHTRPQLLRIAGNILCGEACGPPQIHGARTTASSRHHHLPARCTHVTALNMALPCRQRCAPVGFPPDDAAMW